MTISFHVISRIRSTTRCIGRLIELPDRMLLAIVQIQRYISISPGPSIHPSLVHCRPPIVQSHRLKALASIVREKRLLLVLLDLKAIAILVQC
jgi:hypothetical protein